MPSPVVKSCNLVFNALDQIQSKALGGPLLELALIFEEAWDIDEDVDELVLGTFILLTTDRPWLVYPDRLFQKASSFRDQTDSDLRSV